MRTLSLVPLMLPAVLLAAATKPVVRETPAELTLEGPGYQVSISREGFALKVARNGKTILESAQSGDARPNLGFQWTAPGVQRETVLQGAAPAQSSALGRHRVTKLSAYEALEGVLVLKYGVTFSGAEARVELRPEAGRLRVSTWLLHMEGTLEPSLRYRMAPSGQWYGGGFQGFRDPQVLPLNRARIVKNAFLGQGNTQGTPAWYATAGVGLWVRTPHDFRYSVNQDNDGLLNVEMPGVSALDYDILIGANIREVIDRINREIGWPKTTPPADYFRLPVYTTWVEHKTAVSQQKVLEFARAIRKNNLPCGVIEIDDKWESRYGDMTFDAKKFPNPKAMNDELHKLGIRVTLWVHPFVNADSRTYADPRMRDLLLKDLSGRPGLMKWWQGVAAVWDLSNPRAAAEFRGRLDRLMKTYGFDGFKFDGGDINLLPQDMRSFGHITPFEYPDVYNREAAARYPWEETRVGIYSQPLGIVQRLIDKQSVWGPNNGIESVVPEAITVSMRGFFYVMPDMVGGNEYDGDKVTKELLIRSAQSSALMPLLQFSVGPWHFDEQALRLAREASLLHMRYAPYIVELAQAAPRTGKPILRPLWYNAADNPETHAIMDQFMLGEDMVVAPVVKQGAARRDLYLPAGRWKDAKSGQIVQGGRWLRNYAAPLDTLPLFLREGSRAATMK